MYKEIKMLILDSVRTQMVHFQMSYDYNKRSSMSDEDILEMAKNKYSRKHYIEKYAQQLRNHRDANLNQSYDLVKKYKTLYDKILDDECSFDELCDVLSNLYNHNNFQLSISQYTLSQVDKSIVRDMNIEDLLK